MEIHESHLAFEDLPETIRNASTVGALEATLYRTKLLKNNEEDWLANIHRQSQYIHSTSTSTYQLSNLSLGCNKPNIGHEDISKFLNVFKANKPWALISDICARIGIALLSPKESYIQATKRRHQSAHNSVYDPNYSDIINFINAMIGIALSVDAISTCALQFIKSQDRNYIYGDKKIRSEDIIFRFITELPNGKWKELKEGSVRAVKIHGSKESAIRITMGRNLFKNEFVIVRNKQSIPIGWYYK